MDKYSDSIKIKDLVCDAINFGCVVIVPNDSGEVLNIGGLEVPSCNAIDFLLSLGVSMYEESGVDFDIIPDQTLVHEIKHTGRVSDVRTCIFKKA